MILNRTTKRFNVKDFVTICNGKTAFSRDSAFTIAVSIIPFFFSADQKQKERFVNLSNPYVTSGIANEGNEECYMKL